MRICSYELGVLVWPELFGKDAKMFPTFKQDIPAEEPGDAGTKVCLYLLPYPEWGNYFLPSPWPILMKSGSQDTGCFPNAI